MKNEACYPWPFGYVKITTQGRFVTGIERVDSFFDSEHKSLSDSVYFEVMEYLHGLRKTFTFPVKFEGTDFEVSVWKELRKIPFGEKTSYKELAIKVGKPDASRAVGNAVGKNPILLAVPCHRVLHKDGTIGGFSAGLEVKRVLLVLEGIDYKK